MDAIRAEAPNTIVVLTADNGAWQDGYPDAGTHAFRGDKGSSFEAGWRVPGVMWWPDHIPAGAKYGEMMTHIDCCQRWLDGGHHTAAQGEMMDNNGKPIYFDSIDNSAYILGKAEHSARKSWVYIDGESFRHSAWTSRDEKEPWINIAWKYTWTAKDTWLAGAEPGAIGAIYNLTMDPFEKYDMLCRAMSCACLSVCPKSS